LRGILRDTKEVFCRLSRSQHEWPGRGKELSSTVMSRKGTMLKGAIPARELQMSLPANGRLGRFIIATVEDFPGIIEGQRPGRAP
jgi:hypothetical protein